MQGLAKSTIPRYDSSQPLTSRPLTSYRSAKCLRLTELLLVASSCLVMATPSRAEDVLVLSSGKDGRARTRVTGEIVDYTGETVRLRRAGEREDTYPASRIRQIETRWPTGFEQGQTAYQSGDYATALASFRAAMQAEPREWVKRRLMARAVECFREQRQMERAGELFLNLYRLDPTTPDIGVIPLQWTATPTTAAEETPARKWLNDAQSPAAQLLGASWLLATPDRAKALETLTQLATDKDATKDKRIAMLAEAQLWRARMAVTKLEDLDLWRKQLSRWPESLAAGPYFVLGEAYRRLDQHEPAAWSYLRIPIMFPEQRGLAASALDAAARQIEQLEHSEEAQLVRQELERLQAASAARAP